MKVTQAALDGVREAEEPAEMALVKRLKLKNDSKAQNLCCVVRRGDCGCRGLPTARARVAAALAESL
jgi:hypothetical protein